MKIIELNSKNIVDGFNDVISKRKECCVYGIPDNNFIYVGRGNTINDEFAKKHNVKVLEIPNEGGTIVISKGDLDYGIFKYDGFNIIDGLLKYAVECLKVKIKGIYLDGNDLIVEENGVKYKLGSGSSRDLGNRYIYTALHFSVNVDVDLIKGICKKEMIKIPKALSDYGIDAKKLYDMMKNKLEEL